MYMCVCAIDGGNFSNLKLNSGIVCIDYVNMKHRKNERLFSCVPHCASLFCILQPHAGARHITTYE